MPARAMSVNRASPMWVLCSQTIAFAPRTVVRHQPVERLDHVAVANVPRRRAAAYHRAVVQLGVARDERILLGIEVSFASVGAKLRRTSAQLAKDGDRFVLAGRRHERGRTGIVLHVLGIRLEAVVRAARHRRELRIDALEVLHHGAHRIPERIHIEAVEPRLRLRRPAAIEVAHPFSELHDFAIRPHPRRPPLEGVQDGFGALPRVRVPFHVAIDGIAVRPVAFDGDEREATLGDQALRQLGAPGVELRRAVRRFAKQHVVRVADAVDQWIQIARLLQRSSDTLQPVDDRRWHGILCTASPGHLRRSSD
jgi:hypothetical protein